MVWVIELLSGALKNPGAGGEAEGVLCTLRKGWAVAARRLAQIAALRGKSREQHKEFSVKRIKGRGPGAETKEIIANIPDSFDTLVRKAAKDGNQLQHKINVHEHALKWISIFEKSKHDQVTRTSSLTSTRARLAHATGGVTSCLRSFSRTFSTSRSTLLASLSTQLYVAFAVATATACSENCLCVADAQVLPG